MMSQRPTGLPVKLGRNLGPKGKHASRRQTAWSGFEPLRLVNKKEKQPRMQRLRQMLHLEPHRLQHPLGAEAQWPMLPSEMEVLSPRSQMATGGHGDQTMSLEKGEPGRTRVRILRTRPIGPILILVGWCACSVFEVQPDKHSTD